MDDPLILIHEKKIRSLNAVIEGLEKQKPLLIVAEDMESEALATLILYKLRAGIKIPKYTMYVIYWIEDMFGLLPVDCGSVGMCHKIPLVLEKIERLILQDLATLTGGHFQLITEELGLKLENVTIDMLCSCKKVTVSKDDKIILDGAGDKKVIEERCEQIRSALDLSTSDYDKEKLKKRLAKLSGGIAVLKIGGASEEEVGEKKDTVRYFECNKGSCGGRDWARWWCCAT